MKLPEVFIARMKPMLGSAYDAFEKSFEGSYFASLKVNTLKIDVDTFLKIFPYTLEPVPWNPSGFYYNPEDSITKHPLFYAGLFYVQEPSAMSPVNALQPLKGHALL